MEGEAFPVSLSMLGTDMHASHLLPTDSSPGTKARVFSMDTRYIFGVGK